MPPANKPPQTPAPAGPRRARRGRRGITLEMLNAEAVTSAADFEAMDFAAFDEPREPEKWY